MNFGINDPFASFFVNVSLQGIALRSLPGRVRIEIFFGPAKQLVSLKRVSVPQMREYEGETTSRGSQHSRL